jgi:hypothetical protein
MTHSTTDLKKDIQKGMDDMRALRDELAVKVHLASLDAKEEWRKLEPYVDEVERAATEMTEATRKAVSEAVKRLSSLRSSLL